MRLKCQTLQLYFILNFNHWNQMIIFLRLRNCAVEKLLEKFQEIVAIQRCSTQILSKNNYLEGMADQIL